MNPDRGMTVPDDLPSVSIVATACGTVVRTREVLGFVAAVWLRRVAIRHHSGGLVLLDVRATGVASPVVVAAVADLAAGLRTRGDALLIVRSPRTPQALVRAAGAPVYASLAEAFGCRSCASDSHWVDLPARPSDRLPPTIGGRSLMGPDRSPLPRVPRSGPIPRPSTSPVPAAPTATDRPDGDVSPPGRCGDRARSLPFALIVVDGARRRRTGEDCRDRMDHGTSHWVSLSRSPTSGGGLLDGHRG